MKLTVENLNNSGAFVGAPVERDVTWEQNGEKITATVYVRKLSYASAVADLVSVKSGSDPVAHRIAACICDEFGEPVFSPGDITGESDPKRGALNHNLVMALLKLISEVTTSGKLNS